jgi:hypothetical protein
VAPVEEPRRRRTLTPLSGELRANEADVLGRPPPKPRASLRARLRRRRRPPPRTWREAVARGLARFAVVVGLLSGLAVGVAFLLAWLTGIELQRALTLSFLLGGVLILAAGFFSSAAPMDTDYYYEVPDRERMISNTFVYVAIGFVLVGIGVILDQAL